MSHISSNATPFATQIKEDSILTPSNLGAFHRKLLHVWIDQSLAMGHRQWPQQRPNVIDDELDYEEESFAPTPALTSNNSFDSIESVSTPNGHQITLFIMDTVGNAAKDGEKVDSFPESPIQVKDDLEIRKSTIMAHKDTTPPHIPAIRPGAQPLFAFSFNTLNAGNTSTVYDGTPTQGDRGIWMSKEETKGFRAALAAKKAEMTEEWA